MPIIVELIPDEEQGLFTDLVPHIPAYGEGTTLAEAIEDLKEALRLYIEVRGVDAAISLVRPRAVVRELDIDLTELVGG